MIAVRLGAASDAKEDLGPPEDENCFTVFFVQREKKCWRLESLEFTVPPKSRQAVHWVNALQAWICHHGVTRPKSLLVFINPDGGRKRAVEIYQVQVAPLFALAGIHVQVVETCRANEARDYILQQELCSFEGLVSIGGDGTFNELMHALIDRTQEKAGVSKDVTDVKLLSPMLRIGIIPAGSTDCVCFATVGTNDPVTCALHIIIGDSQPLDVCSIWHERKLLRYSASLLGYGFYGDVVHASEKYRWMGPARYTYAGALAVLSNRSYEGTVEFQLAGTEKANPRDGTRCLSGCMICSESGKHLDTFLDIRGVVRGPSWWQPSRCGTPSYGRHFKVLRTSRRGHFECPCCLWKPTSWGHSKRCRQPAQSPLKRLGEASDGEWQQVQGRFLAINVTCMSSACPKSPEGLSPCAHLADGTADLILVHECSTLSFLRHLKRHTNCSDQFDLPFVSVYRVRAVRFTSSKVEDYEDGEPAARKQEGLCGGVCQQEPPVSCWTCDGEILTHTDISIRVHGQLIHLFARGIEQLPCMP